MKVLFDKKENCCGCSACANICPKNAVTMKSDEYGFSFPHVNEKICIDCGLCTKVCAFQNTEEKNTPLRVYAAARKDKSKILKSASGGMFALFAERIIAEGGVVYGCSMEYRNNELSPEHIMAENEEQLIKLQGSKYVQSIIGSSYKDVKDSLSKGKKVLFSGTPCQIAGLKGVLQKDYENLITADLICHGVPSTDFFKAYIKYLENKRKIKISDFKFRDKESGWGLNAVITYSDKNGNKINNNFPHYKSSYYNMFIDSQTYRESCYNCKYTCSHRPADLTIGDFWGITVMHPEAVTINGGPLDTSKGISGVIINTQKGLEFFEKVSSECAVVESDFEKLSKFNDQLKAPSEKGMLYDKIFESFKTGGYSAVEKYYAPFLRKKKMKQIIKKFMPNKLIRKIKAKK